MKMRIAGIVRSRRFGVLLLGVGLVLASELRAQDPAAAGTPYEQAVAQYLEGATKELQSYHQQIDTVKSPANETSLIEAKQTLAYCDQLLAELKGALPSEFDRVKADYEDTRAKMAKALDEAKGPS